MVYTEFGEIKSLEKEWNAMYVENATLYTPFQSYHSNSIYDKVFNLDGIRLLCKKRYYLVQEGNNKVIIPLIVNRLKKNVRDFATYSPIDYYDLISNTNDVIFLRRALALVLSQYNNYSICISRYSDKSLLKNIFFERIEENKELCAKIILSDTYDAYFSSLSKHQRQNIRTAYNKIKKNNINYYLKEYSGSVIPSSIWQDCQKMYEDRCNVKDGTVLKWFHNRYKRRSNPVNKIIREIDNNRTFVLFFEDKPVAFMSGFFNNDLTVFYVPRLSCNNMYSKYDTGIVLLNEVIKQFYILGIHCIDLTRGGEPYKFSMGGIPHFVFSIKVDAPSLIKALTI